MITDETIVRIQGLRKTFRIGFRRRRVEAVRDATFDVKRGEIFGFIGPNGAGKTTTLKMLMGLIFPDSGEATIFGRSILDVEARRRVGFLPETPHFYDYLRPAELLHYFGELYGVPREVRERRIPELLDLVGLTGAEQKQLRKFSKGMLQRIGLAQALLPDSELVILDEPQSGLDPMGRKDVRDIIVSLRDQGKTVLFSSHILPDVEQICDRVAIIIKGTVTRVGPLHDLIGDPEEYTEVVLRVPDGASVEPIQGIAGTPTRLPGGELRFRGQGNAWTSQVLQVALANRADVVVVQPHRRQLEDVYIDEAKRAQGAS